MRIDSGWWIPDGEWADDRHPALSQIDECRAQLAAALPFVRERRVVVQAGARVGLWPLTLAGIGGFKRVLCFEPDERNYLCARRNVALMPCIELRHGALGETTRGRLLVRSPLSSGEHYIEGLDLNGGSCSLVNMVALDDLDLPVCDALFIDVEGYEIQVLHGAQKTLERCRPVLVLEENACCHRYGYERGALAAMLGRRGYKLAREFSTAPPEVQNDGEFRGADLIFVPEEAVT